MVVSVGGDLMARWQNISNVLLRVRSPEDPVRLRAALTAARREIAALGPDTGSGAAGPAYLAPLIAVPDGQLMIVDFNGVPPSTVRAVPELVARHLTGGGIRDAVVDTPQRIGDRYATVTAFAPAARDTLSAAWNDREPAERGVNRPPGDRLADVLVPDGMWYQILSAGHLARLGGPPPEAHPLPDGRIELTVGTAEQWLPGHPDR